MNRKNLGMMVLAVLLAAGACGAAELSIATVDLDKVFTSHPRTQAAEVELKTAEEKIQAEMEQMIAEGRELEQALAKLRQAARNPLLTDDARRQKRNEVEEKETELEEFELRARRTQERKLGQIREQVMQSRQNIVDELTEAVAAFAKAEGYDLVLDRSGMTMNAIPLTIYSNPGLDVTEKLIERLQAEPGTPAE